MKIHKFVYLLMPVSILMAFLWAPPAAVLGDASRIVYFHVPVAWVASAAFAVAGIDSILMLLYKNTDNSRREIRAYNSALIGLWFSILTVITGSIWAKISWGTYWNWDPRETSAVVLLLIYIAYFSLYSALGTNENRGRISSVYLILAMIIMPFFIFVIPRIYPSLHPDPIINADKKIHMDITMRITLVTSIISFTLLYMYILNLLNRVQTIRTKLEEKIHAH